jgi:hypothetical protein
MAGFVNFSSSVAVQLDASRGRRSEIGHQRVAVCGHKPTARSAPVAARSASVAVQSTSITIRLTTPDTRREASVSGGASETLYLGGPSTRRGASVTPHLGNPSAKRGASVSRGASITTYLGSRESGAAASCKRSPSRIDEAAARHSPPKSITVPSLDGLSQPQLFGCTLRRTSLRVRRSTATRTAVMARASHSGKRFGGHQRSRWSKEEND